MRSLSSSLFYASSLESSKAALLFHSASTLSRFTFAYKLACPPRRSFRLSDHRGLFTNCFNRFFPFSFKTREIFDVTLSLPEFRFHNQFPIEKKACFSFNYYASSINSNKWKFYICLKSHMKAKHLPYVPFKNPRGNLENRVSVKITMHVGPN